MTAIQEILLFSSAILISVIVISGLYGLVADWSAKGESVSQRLVEKTVREICIRSVYSDGTDTNVYISAVLGVFDLNDLAVYVDGVDANIISYGILRDSGMHGLFDGSPNHQDLAYVEIAGNIFDGNLHRITVRVMDAYSNVHGRSSYELTNCQ